MLLRGLEHGGGNGLDVIERHCHEAGAGAAEEAADRASTLRGGEDIGKAGNQHLPIGLVQMVDKHAAQARVIAAAKGDGDARRALRIFHRVAERDFLRRQ